MSVPSIKFRPRKTNSNDAILQGYITLHGVTAPKFSTQIRISKGLTWIQKQQHFVATDKNNQELTGLANSKNAILIQIATKINYCFTNLSILGKLFTVRDLKRRFENEWSVGEKKIVLPTAIKNFENYIAEISPGLAPKTICKYEMAKTHFINYIKTKKRKDLELEEILPITGFEFFEFVKSQENTQTKGKISPITSKRYLQYLTASFEFAYSKGLILTNPLSDVKVKVKAKKSNKTIVTEANQLQIYRLQQLTQTERFVADITTFLFYTAFDYCDIYDFKRNIHIVEINGVHVIRKKRYKMRKSDESDEVLIPINNILTEILFIKYPVYFPHFSYQTIWRIYKNLCSRIGFEKYSRMSLKQIRKSGGSYYLNNSVPLKVVSAKVFGHTEQSITETKYAVIEDSTMIRESLHLIERG